MHINPLAPLGGVVGPMMAGDNAPVIAGQAFGKRQFFAPSLLYAPPSGAGVTGSGTPGKLPKWSGASALTDSLFTESGTDMTLAARLLFTADNARDIGATLATRPRTIYLGTSLLMETTSPGRIMNFGAQNHSLRWDDNSLYTLVTFTNADSTLATYGVRLLFQSGTGSNGTAFPSAAIDAMPETAAWTAVAATQNGRLVLSTAVAGVMSEKVRVGTASIRLTAHVDFTTDNTYDLGTSGNKARTIYAQTSVELGVTTGTGIIGRLNTGTSATCPAFLMYTGGSARGIVGIAAAAGDIVAGSSASMLAIRSEAVGIIFSLDGGSTIAAKWTSDMYQFVGRPVVGPGSAMKTVDQASFANVQTNIILLTFTIGTADIWVVDCFLPLTMVGATGVKFYFTAPAGATGEVSMTGTGAALTTVEHVYTAAITVPGTFLARIAGATFVQVRATIRSGGTGGAVQLVGITGAAATTCVVKKGASMFAERLQ